MAEAARRELEARDVERLVGPGHEGRVLGQREGKEALRRPQLLDPGPEEQRERAAACGGARGPPTRR
eukprot:10479341-Lingulodinium_polyedra.AAC.1